MNYLNKIIGVIKKPQKLAIHLSDNGHLFVPDDLYIKIQYSNYFGETLNLKSPKSFNEKLQWLKLYNRNPEYTQMVDKYEVRDYITDKIGNDYLIPLYGIWNNFDEIDFNALPNQFVLKTTHDSGGVIICKDKEQFDFEAAKRNINYWFSRNYYKIGREWPYKNVKPRIIAEKYMVDESGSELKDYKIFCFSGDPKLIQVDFNRFVAHKRNLYTKDWDLVDVAFEYKSDPTKHIEKPLNLEKMLELAHTLSEGIPFLRVDLYSIYDKIYFGELTLYPESGYGHFHPKSFDLEMGSWMPLQKFNSAIKR